MTTDNMLKSKAFKLKGRLFTFTVLHLLDTDLPSFSLQLSEVVAKAPRLFEHTPVVLDLSAVVDTTVDLQAICASIRELGLVPVAVTGGNALLHTVAQCQGLAVLNASSLQDKSLTEKRQKSESPILKTIKTKLLTSPVRSGQQVVSKGGDLVITATVSHGAELLADGNIHVYGALRGRALAGIAGNKEARIFCQSLEAELVSIAGFYRLRDAIEPVMGPCQIFLQDDHIAIERL